MPVPTGATPSPTMRAAAVDVSWLQHVWDVKVPEAVAVVETAAAPSASPKLLLLQQPATRGVSVSVATCTADMEAEAQRPASRLGRVRAVLYDYGHTSTFHGVGLIGNTSLSRHERFMWAVAVVVSAALLSYWCQLQVTEYADAPTVTRLEQNNLPTYSFAFPAVTVCHPSLIKAEVVVHALQEYLQSMGDRVHARSFDEEYLLSAANDTWTPLLRGVMQALSYYHYPRFRLMKHGLSLLGSRLTYLDGLDIGRIMMSARLNCRDLLAHCYWKGVAFACCQQFQLQHTDMGYCMSFNSRTSSGPKILCTEKNCHHVWSTGPGTGLVLVFRDIARDWLRSRPLTQSYIDNQNRNLRSWANSKGASLAMRPTSTADVWDGEEIFMKIRSWVEWHNVQVLIHDRTRIPTVDEAFSFSTMLKTDFSVALSYSTTSAADSLKKMSFKERNCFLPHEAKLKTALSYSQPECIAECRMEYMVAACGCRPYYVEFYSAGPAANAIPACRFSQLPCLSELDLVSLNCSHCSMACHFTRYAFRVNPSIQADFSDANLGTSVDISYDSYIAAVLYRQQQARSVLDVWVAIGSLVSLFLGCSIISALDILHLLLRVVRVALGADYTPIYQ